MTDIPAGWYDDPEDPSQYRYWDGHQWSDHRAPKTAGATDDSAWNTVPAALALLGRSWRELVVLALPIVAIAITSTLLFFGALDAMLEPDLDVILERIGEPGFDPTDGGADQEFWESIDVAIDAGAGVVLAIATALLVLGSVATSLAMTIHLAAAQAGQPTSVVQSYRIALFRLPRVIGVYLLWVLGAVAVAAVVVALALLTPLTLLLTVPALLALVIALYPVVFVAFTELLVGPRDHPPLRHTWHLVRDQWGRVAARVLVVSLSLLGLSVVTGLATAPLSGASVTAGFLASSILQVAQAVASSAASVVVHQRAGGTVATEISGTPATG